MSANQRMCRTEARYAVINALAPQSRLRRFLFFERKTESTFSFDSFKLNCYNELTIHSEFD